MARMLDRMKPALMGGSPADTRINRAKSVHFDSPRSRVQMHTLGDMAKALNRSALYLSGLQVRFELPVLEGERYSDAYLGFLRKVVYLRALFISEETLRDLWHIEKKLLQLLHVHSTGSPTWFLDACGRTTHARRRLLLTNHDMGVKLPSRALQLGLNFAADLPELFAGKEMGEDALRVLGRYLKLHAHIQADVMAEAPQLRAATRWSARMR